MLFPGLSYAEDAKPHKVVIQVSTDAPKTQNLALNNATNLQEACGLDNIEIEIVAYGPGLSLMVADIKQARKLKILAKRGATLSACMNTMKNIKQKTGEFPVLHEDVRPVPGGVARIVELQEDGYAYVRP
jgi:hypothetical protein